MRDLPGSQETVPVKGQPGDFLIRLLYCQLVFITTIIYNL
jgi:hypothetical protein